MAGQGHGLYPGGQVGGQRDDDAPDPILVEVMQAHVGQAVILDVADAVLAACPAAPQLQVGQLPAGGVGDECGDPMPVQIGDPQQCAGVGAPCGRSAHPGRPAGEVEQSGEVGHPGTRTNLAVGVVGSGPSIGGDAGQPLPNRDEVTGQREADRVGQSAAGQPGDQLVGAAGAVDPDSTFFSGRASTSAL